MNLRELLLIKNGETIPGIPDRNKFQNIPKVKDPVIWEFAVHSHEAEVAGPHKDLRLGDPETGHAHSWVIQHLPKPGEKVLAIHQPTHTLDYMNFEGKIESGYGKGNVSLEARDKVEVVKAEPGKLSFVVHKSTTPGRYTLIKAFDGKNWLLVNHTPTRLSRSVPAYKPKYKEKELSKLDYMDDSKIWSPKIDGAHALFVLRKDKPIETYSYRVSRKDNNALIDHTFKTSLYRNIAPPEVGNETVLRGELFAKDNTGKVLASNETSGMLNASTMKSRELQAEKGGLDHIIYDIDTYRGRNVANLPYRDKFPLLKEVVDLTPGLKLAPMAQTWSDKQMLLSDVKSGRYPLTSEGIVEFDLDSPVPSKMKMAKDTEVYIRGFYPAAKNSKYDGVAVGGIIASLKKDGPANIRIGSGLTDDLRRDFFNNPGQYIGKLIKVSYQDFYPATEKFRMPVFLGFREMW